MTGKAPEPTEYEKSRQQQDQIIADLKKSAKHSGEFKRIHEVAKDIQDVKAKRN